MKTIIDPVWPMLANIRERRPSLGQHRPSLVDSGQHLTVIGQVWSHLREFRTTVRQRRPSSGQTPAEFGRNWPTLDHCRPVVELAQTSVKCRPASTKVCPTPATFSRLLLQFGHVWAASVGQVWPTPTEPGPPQPVSVESWAKSPRSNCSTIVGQVFGNRRANWELADGNFSRRVASNRSATVIFQHVGDKHLRNGDCVFPHPLKY